MSIYEHFDSEVIILIASCHEFLKLGAIGNYVLNTVNM